MHYEDNREFAAAQDIADPLAKYRDQFNFPLERDGRAPVYLCGNSLGLQPKLAVQYVEDELQNWKDYAVDGHFHSDRPWISYHRQCVAGFSALTGAKSSEVVAMNTLTVNRFHRTVTPQHRKSACTVSTLMRACSSGRRVTVERAFSRKTWQQCLQNMATALPCCCYLGCSTTPGKSLI